jgi:hypothetical protein
MTAKTAILIGAAAMGVFVLLTVAAVGAFLLLSGSRQPEAQPPVPPAVDSTVPWTSSEAAAPESVEGQLRSQGKRWVRTQGPITVGAYVQDILEGRFGQPKGRGAIGKVTLISRGENGVEAAMVDFGGGNAAGINLSELSRVELVPE